MVELACTDDPRFSVSGLDAPRPDGGPNYTVDTLTRMQSLFPDAQRFNLAGADSFLTLGRWREPARLLDLAEWIVVSRPGFSLVEPEGLRVDNRQLARIHRVDSVHGDVAAAGLRERVRRDETGTQLLPPLVSAYIQQGSLYRT